MLIFWFIFPDSTIVWDIDLSNNHVNHMIWKTTPAPSCPENKNCPRSIWRSKRNIDMRLINNGIAHHIGDMYSYKNVFEKYFYSFRSAVTTIFVYFRVKMSKKNIIFGNFFRFWWYMMISGSYQTHSGRSESYLANGEKLDSAELIFVPFSTLKIGICCTRHTGCKNMRKPM